MQLRIENEVIYVTVIVTIKLNTYLILNNILSKFMKAIVIHVHNVSDYSEILSQFRSEYVIHVINVMGFLQYFTFQYFTPIPYNVCCRLLIYVYPLWLHLNDQDDKMPLTEGALECFLFSMVLFMYS